MCDKLVGRIDQVDAEVASMLEKWRSVEEGGKSLQDASQKLLDERVRLRLDDMRARAWGRDLIS
jgi:conserved oligomeric Golgi complex subunit 3